MKDHVKLLKVRTGNVHGQLLFGAQYDLNQHKLSTPDVFVLSMCGLGKLVFDLA